jgi:hypothetical protein
MPASRTVSLNFPAAHGQDKVSLTVSNTQVQEALKVIDGVLVSRGFVRDPNLPGEGDPSFIASYSTYTGAGLRPIGGPSIYFKDNRLDVVVVEGSNLNSPVSTATKKICKSLRKELISRYGAERVRIEN